MVRLKSLNDTRLFIPLYWRLLPILDNDRVSSRLGCQFKLFNPCPTFEGNAHLNRVRNALDPCLFMEYGHPEKDVELISLCQSGRFAGKDQ
jgi:hypothetical protein